MRLRRSTHQRVHRRLGGTPGGEIALHDLPPKILHLCRVVHSSLRVISSGLTAPAESFVSQVTIAVCCQEQKAHRDMPEGQAMLVVKVGAAKR